MKTVKMKISLFSVDPSGCLYYADNIASLEHVRMLQEAINLNDTYWNKLSIHVDEKSKLFFLTSKEDDDLTKVLKDLEMDQSKKVVWKNVRCLLDPNNRFVLIEGSTASPYHWHHYISSLIAKAKQTSAVNVYEFTSTPDQSKWQITIDSDSPRILNDVIQPILQKKIPKKVLQYSSEPDTTNTFLQSNQPTEPIPQGIDQHNTFLQNSQQTETPSQNAQKKVVRKKRRDLIVEENTRLFQLFLNNDTPNSKESHEQVRNSQFRKPREPEKKLNFSEINWKNRINFISGNMEAKINAGPLFAMITEELKKLKIDAITNADPNTKIITVQFNSLFAIQEFKKFFKLEESAIFNLNHEKNQHGNDSPIFKKRKTNPSVITTQSSEAQQTVEKPGAATSDNMTPKVSMYAQEDTNTLISMVEILVNEFIQDLQPRDLIQVRCWCNAFEALENEFENRELCWLWYVPTFSDNKLAHETIKTKIESMYSFLPEDDKSALIRFESAIAMLLTQGPSFKL